jgi:hypothetical protein
VICGDDTAELGIAAVDALGTHGIAMQLRIGKLILELVVLRQQAVH